MRLLSILIFVYALLASPVQAADPVGVCTRAGSSTRTTQAGCTDGTWDPLGSCTCTTGAPDTRTQSTCIAAGCSWQSADGATTMRAGGPVVGFGNPLCPNPETPCSAPAIIGRLIKAVLGIVGAIALVMFIWGGFLWMMAGSGGEKKVQLAKDVLIWSTLGLLIIFSSYLMVNFVIQRLQP